MSVIGIVGAGVTLIWGQEINAFLRTLLYIILVLSLIVTAKNVLTTITGVGAEIPIVVIGKAS